MYPPFNDTAGATRFYNLPMVEWDKAYTAMAQAEIFELERQAAEVATRYARLSAYLSRRMAGGIHADAVRRQNQTAAKVRQALGYTYKDAPITF